jgi:hypothetical protein
MYARQVKERLTFLRQHARNERNNAALTADPSAMSSPSEGSTSLRGYAPLPCNITHSSAAVGALESEPEDSAQPSGDVIHDGCWQLAGGCFQVGLVQGDQGGDVDD